jgi:hypothetical protein
MLMRRVHLYLGLFLIPWVLVYAVTGFLFNHPTVWVNEPPAAVVQSFGPEATRGTVLAEMPTARELAEEVTAALQRRTANRGTATSAVRLVAPERAYFDWPTFSIDAHGADRTHTASIQLKDGSGTVATRAGPDAAAAPFAAKEGVFGEPPLPSRLKQAAPQLFARLGLERERVQVRSVPELTFFLEADGRLWLAKYDPLSGALSGKPVEQADGLPAQQFLKNLHFSAGYPGPFGPRWWWAVAVDGVALALVFWCVSGLFMWWQVKAVRLAGMVVLLSSIASATALALAMYGLFNP